MINKKYRTFWSAVVLPLLCLVWLTPRLSASPPLWVFAASSTTEALTEVVNQFNKDTRYRVKLSFASSSALARQIETGYPVNLFISANEQWVEYLESKKRLLKQSRVPLLGNSLVVVAAKGKHSAQESSYQKNMKSMIESSGRLALGDPEHVPAGVYAKQAMQELGWWEKIEPRIVPALDARNALAYVERGECEWGIVYRSDALSSNKVEIISTLPESQQKIIYYAAIVSTYENDLTWKLLKYMQGEKASAIFKKHGFKIIKPD